MVVSSTTMSSQEVAKFINHHYRVAVEVIQALGGEDPDCARFVGGMVRDMLLGTVAYDIDIAVSHTPEEATAIIERAGMKAIPTGLAHGTITVVHKGIPMQITSLRQDVDCDGRHAKVVFSKDWKADAKRRDFTFNALSASQHGQIYDYTGGLEDLLNGNVRFIGAFIMPAPPLTNPASKPVLSMHQDCAAFRLSVSNKNYGRFSMSRRFLKCWLSQKSGKSCKQSSLS